MSRPPAEDTAEDTAEDALAAEQPPLLWVDGDATAEEVAALVVVLHAASAGAAPATRAARPEWSAPHRGVRPAIRHGRAGWRSSALPH